MFRLEQEVCPLLISVDTVFCPGLESCFGSGIHFPFNPNLFKSNPILSKSVQVSISVKSKFSSPGSKFISRVQSNFEFISIQSNCSGSGFIDNTIVLYILLYFVCMLQLLYYYISIYDILWLYLYLCHTYIIFIGVYCIIIKCLNIYVCIKYIIYV